MPSQRLLILLVAPMAVVFVLLATVVPAWTADREKVLHSFNGKDGSYPHAGVIFDTAGNLYGTTTADPDFPCSDGCGTVFELAPDTNGKWTRTILHRFSGNDGANPFGSLIFDAERNLYGTTWFGGNCRSCGHGRGTVFKLSRGAEGKWTETVLHSFTDYDGEKPAGGLIFDAAGNLYGTTWDGGFYGCGNVFRLAPGTNGKWTHTVLHTFNCKDGSIIYAGLVLDKEGNLYGATARGGAYDDGTIFKLALGAHGKWIHTVLHTFHGKDGSAPTATLIFDSIGDLYGTTQEGGKLNDCNGTGCGTVFRLSPGANAKWTETVLHRFTGKDGAFPASSLRFDGTGNLYGTATGGPNYGTAFKLVLGGNGKWTETVLHTFNKNKDGMYPDGSVTFDAAGNLYGTTIWGGLNACPNNQGDGCGVVFEILP